MRFICTIITMWLYVLAAGLPAAAQQTILVAAHRGDWRNAPRKLPSAELKVSIF
jgi:hypothetical protein